MANKVPPDPNKVNPYVFVPVEGKVERKAASKGDLSGVISCKLEAITPLALPDHETCQEDENFDCFTVDGVPTITGSSIRGVIRSVYEILSNGCLSVVNNVEVTKNSPNDHAGNHVSALPLGTVEKLLNEAGNFAPCIDTSEVCPSCNLFGIIGSDKALASRVRFSDAKPVKPIQRGNYETLAVLSSPRIESKLYTSKKREFKTDETKFDNNPKHYELSGRKLYLHYQPTDKSYKSKKDNQNSTIELIDEGAEFSFNVFFDKVTESELNRLIYVLTLGENNKYGDKMHKLGHGKPLGFGSVKITVDEVTTRTFSQGDYKEETKKVDSVEADFDKETWVYKDFHTVADYKDVANYVQLPKYFAYSTYVDNRHTIANAAKAKAKAENERKDNPTIKIKTKVAADYSDLAKKLLNLSKNAKKPTTDFDRKSKEANDKLKEFLISNPCPNDADDKLVALYREAEDKLKKLKWL